MTTNTTTVLITCPPMLRSIDRYRELLSQQGIHPVCPQIVQTMTEEELIVEVPKHDAWIIGDDPATAKVFSAGVAGKLKAAVKWGVGIDNVDFDGARAVGLDVVNTPGMFSDEVADVAMCYVTTLARSIFSIHEGVKDHQWPKPKGVSLKNKIAVVLGYGNIGRETTDRLVAAKMNVIVVDPTIESDSVFGPNISKGVWPTCAYNADFIVATCSLNVSTHHIINKELIDKCKRGVRIVNVSRGPLIDEKALVDGLDSGTVHSAALEVFEIEPLPAISQLRKFPQCIFGSHNASNTQEAVDRTSDLAIQLITSRLAAVVR